MSIIKPMTTFYGRELVNTVVCRASEVRQLEDNAGEAVQYIFDNIDHSCSTCTGGDCYNCNIHNLKDLLKKLSGKTYEQLKEGV